MRIISGEFGSRRIKIPRNLTIRPTTDQAKEGIFNIISNKVDLMGLKILDLFSGSGMVGLEFISRGAKVTFVEKNFEHFDKLKSYIEKLNATEEISIINKDVLAWLDEANDEFDLIFVDPPFYETLAEKVLLKIKRNSLLAKSGNIYLEVEKDLDLSFLEKNWEVIKETNSGKKQYLLLKEK